MQLRFNKKKSTKKKQQQQKSNPSTQKKKNTPQNNKIKQQQQQQKLTTAKKEMKKKKIFAFMSYPADYYRIIVNEYDCECRAVHDYEHHAWKRKEKTNKQKIEKGEKIGDIKKKKKGSHSSVCNWGWKNNLGSQAGKGYCRGC